MWRFLHNRRLILRLHTIFRALIYWAHRAVIFAIAQLSCWNGVIILSAGGEVRDQSDQWDRFAVILYNQGQFVFSARRWDNTTSSYICQFQQGLSIIQPHSVLNVV